MVEGIEPEEPPFSDRFFEFGDMVLFEAADESGRGELWRTDGTAAGTMCVRNINGPRSSSAPQQLTAAGDGLFFAAWPDGGGRHLFTSDGTAVGTSLIDYVGQASQLTALGLDLVFVGADQEGEETLWVSDGSPAGTEQLCASCLESEELTPIGDTLYLNAWNDIAGRTVWRSNGTTEGTLQLGAEDLNWGTALPWGFDCWYFPRHFTALGDSVYFLGSTEDEGVALWKVDGDLLELVTSLPFDPCDPTEVVSMDDQLYLSNRMTLWRSDGSAEGTAEVTSFDDPIRSLTPVAGSLFFVQLFDYRWDRLWKVSGNDVELVSDLVMDGHSSIVTEVSATDDLLFLSVHTNPVGHELWVSDGTESGTGLVKDIFPGNRGSNPQNLAAVGDLVLFAADDGVTGHELWCSDGSPEGTYLVDDIYTGRFASSPSDLTLAGAVVYFVADDGTGRELWSIPIDGLDRSVYLDGFGYPIAWQ